MNHYNFDNALSKRTIEHMISLLKIRAMTVVDLEEAMCIPHGRAMVFTALLRRENSPYGPVHIESWHRRGDGKGKSMARYRYGKGEDAPTPTQIKRQQVRVKEPLSEDEMDELIDQRLKEAARRKQAKYPIQRHWLIAALYGPAKTQQHENRSST